jgi:hypothetical protein
LPAFDISLILTIMPEHGSESGPFTPPTESNMNRTQVITTIIATIALLSVGCKIERATILPSDVPSLNRPASQLASDAKARFPFPIDFERGGETAGRVEVGYSLNSLNLLNYSGQPWTDVDLWINRQYVVNLSNVPSNKLIAINFKHLFNESGSHFPTNNRLMKVQRVELRQGVRVFDLPVQAGR